MAANLEMHLDEMASDFLSAVKYLESRGFIYQEMIYQDSKYHARHDFVFVERETGKQVLCAGVDGVLDLAHKQIEESPYELLSLSGEAGA